MLISPVRIQLWSCPRNVSTALLYAFAQRADTRVWDEPLYAHFLRVSGALRPDREATLAASEQDGATVLRDELKAPFSLERSVHFYKHIVNQWVALPDEALPELGRHVMFIRHPVRIVASYARVVSSPDLDDVAMPAVATFYDKLCALGLPPLVLDAAELLAQPASMLATLCEACGIPPDPAMLHWPAGARPEDGPWAPWWYSRLHQSTGFAPAENTMPELDGKLAALAEACMPAYRRLHALRLRPKANNPNNDMPTGKLDIG